MFKQKIFSILFLLLILLQGTSFASTKNVIDLMDALSQEEETLLQQEVDLVIEEMQLEPVIVITDDMENKSSMAYADDYFDYNGFGIGEDRQGILLLINMEQRELWISTSGDTTIAQFDPHIDNMVKGIVPYLKAADYQGAGLFFLHSVSEYANTSVTMESFPTENSYSTENSYFSDNTISSSEIEMSYLEKLLYLMGSFIPYLIGIVVAFIATISITVSSKGKKTITNRSYETKNSFHLHQKLDTFIREDVTKRKIQTSSSSGSSSSRSSSHSSSSGRSHGGGGGSF